MRRILAIMGSERLQSNTAYLFDYILDTYYPDDMVQEVILKKLDFKRCISCYGCAKVPHCVVKDGMTGIYPAIEDYDEIVFFTPIYFNSVSAISKAFIDRMQVYWSRKYLLKMDPLKEKKATVFLVGGAPHYEEQFIAAPLVFDYFFQSINCRNNKIIAIANTDDKNIDEKNEEVFEFIDRAMKAEQKEKTDFYMTENE